MENFVYCIKRKDRYDRDEFLTYDSTNGYRTTNKFDANNVLLFPNFKKAYDGYKEILNSSSYSNMELHGVSLTRIDLDFIDENISRIQDRIDVYKNNIADEEEKIKKILSSPKGISDVSWNTALTQHDARKSVIKYMVEHLVPMINADANIYEGDVMVVKPNGYVHNRTNKVGEFDLVVPITSDMVKEAALEVHAKREMGE